MHTDLWAVKSAQIPTKRARKFILRPIYEHVTELFSIKLRSFITSMLSTLVHSFLCQSQTQGHVLAYHVAPHHRPCLSALTIYHFPSLSLLTKPICILFHRPTCVSGSIRTAFTDLGLRPDLYWALARICLFSSFAYIFFCFLIMCARLAYHTVRFNSLIVSNSITVCIELLA